MTVCAHCGAVPLRLHRRRRLAWMCWWMAATRPRRSSPCRLRSPSHSPVRCHCFMLRAVRLPLAPSCVLRPAPPRRVWSLRYLACRACAVCWKPLTRVCDILPQRWARRRSAPWASGIAWPTRSTSAGNSAVSRHVCACSLGCLPRTADLRLFWALADLLLQARGLPSRATPALSSPTLRYSRLPHCHAAPC